MSASAEIAALMPLAKAWAAEQEEYILHHNDARPLTQSEQETARRAGISQPERVRILIVSKMPLPSDLALRSAAQTHGLDEAGGTTYGRGIFIHENCLDDAELISHELRHVAQVERAGNLAAFVETYLAELMSYGYHDMPLELDAKDFASGKICGLATDMK
jgi:hypothetical protein